MSIYSEWNNLSIFELFDEGSSKPSKKEFLDISSGEQINLKIEVFDHFNQITTDLNGKILSCTTEKPLGLKGYSFTEENNVKEFNKNSINMTSFSIITPYIGDKLSLNCKVLLQNPESLYDNYSSKYIPIIPLKINPCKRGQVIQQYR